MKSSFMVGVAILQARSKMATGNYGYRDILIFILKDIKNQTKHLLLQLSASICATNIRRIWVTALERRCDNAVFAIQLQ